MPAWVEREEVTAKMVLPGSNIVVGPYAERAQIREVEFVKSSGRVRDCPHDDRPEFAIVGRSNVGKSSLINTLVRKKEIALTSKKPGAFVHLHLTYFVRCFWELGLAVLFKFRFVSISDSFLCVKFVFLQGYEVQW